MIASKTIHNVRFILRSVQNHPNQSINRIRYALRLFRALGFNGINVIKNFFSRRPYIFFERHTVF
jgi:hypothetical protein